MSKWIKAEKNEVLDIDMVLEGLTPDFWKLLAENGIGVANQDGERLLVKKGLWTAEQLRDFLRRESGYSEMSDEELEQIIKDMIDSGRTGE